MTAATSPTLGQVLRAARFGFFWSCDHGLFVRLSTPEEGVIVAELAPPGLVPTEKHEHPFRCWHAPPAVTRGEGCILRASPALEEVRCGVVQVTDYETWRLDDEGRRIP